MAPRKLLTGVAGLSVVVALAGGCSSDQGSTAAETPEGTAPATSASPSGEASPSAPGPSAESEPLANLPADPPLGDPAALAGHLRRVVAALHDRDATPEELRRAGQFEQLAARDLARAPERVRRAVLGRLQGLVGMRTRAHVEAAALLDEMTTPQPALPDWRIQEPPPPGELVSHYRFAAGRIGVPWEFLAAIHLVETRMGRIRGVSSAGALGPMQFLPTTWDLYGESGDIDDPRDAILAAARLLRANGAPGNMHEAVWHYNPSDNYVGAVVRYAEQLRRSPASYRGYWHWRVLYRHQDGTYVLPVGYPEEPAVLLPPGS
jgi:soluble lytic murein transglycosylase-like protein